MRAEQASCEIPFRLEPWPAEGPIDLYVKVPDQSMLLSDRKPTRIWQREYLRIKRHDRFMEPPFRPLRTVSFY